jgi:hypothetical protein
MKLAYKRKRKEADEMGDEDYLAKVAWGFPHWLCVFGLHILLASLWFY